MALPLSFVLAVSMIKDAFEDYKRHKSDAWENEMKTQIFDKETKDFKLCSWKDIRPGDVVKVLSEQQIPADLVLLHSSEVKGNLYIETKNLDGETNLKTKQVHKEMIGHF